MILIVVKQPVRAKYAEDFPSLVGDFTTASRAEPGCIEHGVTIDANDGLRLVFFERWADLDALLVHFRVPASREFGAQAARLATRPPDLAAYDATELKLR